VFSSGIICLVLHLEGNRGDGYLTKDTPHQEISLSVPIFTGNLDRQRAFTWSLVLSAIGIQHKLKHLDDGWMILVPEDKLDEARRQIRLFELENRDTDLASKLTQKKPIRYLRQSLWTLLFISALMSVTFRYEIRDLVLRIGSADSGKIVDGQWWRAVTALFLHADPSHFLSNMAIGGFIVIWLIEELGPGMGWFVILLSGFLGNFLTALFHGHDGHLSIGASTSIFGGLGALVAVRAVTHGKKGLMKEALRAVAAGIALLAMLGSGQDHVDIGAHFFGFVSGLLVGAIAGISREHLSEKGLGYTDKILAGLTIFSTVGAWIMAILQDK